LRLLSRLEPGEALATTALSVADFSLVLDKRLFVEAGPFVIFRKDFFKMNYPFSLESPMGWGYDLTWPIIAREHGLKIGIIDSVPVDHSLRARGALYNDRTEAAVMARYLSTRPHVHPSELRRALRVYR
jgi:hypothetical protein